MSKELEEIKSIVAIHFGALGFLNPSENERILKDRDKVLNALTELQSIKESNPSEALEELELVENWIRDRELKSSKVIEPSLATIKQALLKAQEQEKENELLKEIIKSLFDRGCPLHQYIDNDFGLTIEADNECSIMHLGKYKGIDLDEKLKEVLDNE